MNKGKIIERTREYVKSVLEGEGSGHDWWHIYRVWRNAILIGKSEDVDMLVVELGALLHDIADYKFHDGDEKIGGQIARKWLENLGVEESIISQVVHVVDNVSFKGKRTKNSMESLEGKVVQDADRLDAVGAMGIARTFAYGGNRGNEIHNPDISPKLNMTKEDYKNHKGTQINHFYEKLLLLKDLMNTKTGKKMAEGRHKFMEEYLEQFFAEWDGER